MKLPFVSIDRYNEAVARIKELEAEKLELIDRLLVAHGAKPMHVPAVIATTPPAEGEKPKPVPPRSRPSPFELASMATEAKRKEFEQTKAVS